MENKVPAEFQSYRIEKEVKEKSLVKTLAIVLILLMAVSFHKHHKLHMPLFVFFVLNFVCYFGFPKLYTQFAKLWGKLGLLLHHIVQPLFIGLLFFVVFLPIGILMRLFGKDPLWLKGQRYKSLWQKPSSSASFRDQF